MNKTAENIVDDDSDVDILVVDGVDQKGKVVGGDEEVIQRGGVVKKVEDGEFYLIRVVADAADNNVVQDLLNNVAVGMGSSPRG